MCGESLTIIVTEGPSQGINLQQRAKYDNWQPGEQDVSSAFAAKFGSVLEIRVPPLKTSRILASCGILLYRKGVSKQMPSGDLVYRRDRFLFTAEK